MKFLGIKVPRTVHLGDFILRVLDYTVTMSFGYILYCSCFNLFCNVWVCVYMNFVMCGCFGNKCTGIYCVLYCLYCVFLYCFVSVYLFLFVLSLSDN